LEGCNTLTLKHRRRENRWYLRFQETKLNVRDFSILTLLHA
jgi:hypothetical protein